LKKDLIRKLYLKKRNELSPSKFDKDSKIIIDKTIEFIKKYNPKCIHCFLPISSKKEIDTLPIIKYCWENNIQVVIPVSNFELGTMKSAEFIPSTKTIITINNITEPIKPVWQKIKIIDVVITPLLAFNNEGYRVGYGKGFYDRFFYSLSNNIKRIGLSLFENCNEIENINEKDIPLTHCITPEKTCYF
jgi:5-formyltetrahydrofolate cyclo-ligase